MRVLSKISAFKKEMTLESGDNKFVDFSKKNWRQTTDVNNKGEVIIDRMINELYIFRSSYTTNYFRENYDLNIKYFYFLFFYKFILKLFSSFFSKYTRSHKLYNSFGCEFGFTNTWNDLFVSRLKSIKFNSKNDILDYSIDGIRIGDLIYDTYLRVYSVPTVDLNDRRLLKITRDAICVFNSAKKYLKNNNVRVVILSHTVYINYGIIARIAAHSDIDVYIFDQSLAMHKITRSHYSQYINHNNYPNEFKKLDNQAGRLNKSRKIMKLRFGGKIDSGISYMASSPYKTVDNIVKKIFKHNGKTKVVIMLHCFFDAAHKYDGYMIFPDVFEWIEFVLNTLKTLDIDLVVKPHPNGKPGNEKIINILKEKYPNAMFIDKKISNNDILSESPNIMITLNGTAAFEFAYHGVTVITSGDGPISSYDFVLKPQSVLELEEYLHNMDNLKVDLSKKKIEEFFYMHYMNKGHGRLNEKNYSITERPMNHRINNVQDHTIFHALVDEVRYNERSLIFDNISRALKQIS